MLDELKDEIYEDILINIPEFSKLRYLRKDHPNGFDAESRDNKDTLHIWPNQYAIDRFHRSNKNEYTNELYYYNIHVHPSQFMMIYTPQNFTDIPSDVEKLNFERFKFLENYYNLIRIMDWASANLRVNITLNYQNLFPNEFDDRKIVSNTVLLDYLMKRRNRDNLTWKIELEDNPSKYVEFDYELTPLIFNELKMYFDQSFTISKSTSTSPEVGYGLLDDKVTYDEIAEKSYSNFKLMVEDPHLFLSVKENYQEFY